MTEPDKKDVGIASAEDNSQAGTSARRNPDDNDAEERIRAVVADYEARIDEVADVIARVRHEINNPLTGVLGQAQLLLREDLSEKGAEARGNHRGAGYSHPRYRRPVAPDSEAPKVFRQQ